MSDGGEGLVPFERRGPVEVFLDEVTTFWPTSTSYPPLEERERPRKEPSQPRGLRLGLCWWDGGLSTTAREPKEARSITRGGLPVSRWCGDTFTSAGEEPTDETVELCHSTAYATSHGHRRVGASVESLIAAAVSEMSPMVRSAIGFKSWS